MRPRWGRCGRRHRGERFGRVDGLVGARGGGRRWRARAPARRHRSGPGWIGGQPDRHVRGWPGPCFARMLEQEPIDGERTQLPIVTLASIEGLEGTAGGSAYNASKGGVVLLTKIVHHEGRRSRGSARRANRRDRRSRPPGRPRRSRRRRRSARSRASPRRRGRCRPWDSAGSPSACRCRRRRRRPAASARLNLSAIRCASQPSTSKALSSSSRWRRLRQRRELVQRDRDPVDLRRARSRSARRGLGRPAGADVGMVDQHVEGARLHRHHVGDASGSSADERSTPTIWLAVSGSTR